MMDGESSKPFGGITLYVDGRFVPSTEMGDYIQVTENEVSTWDPDPGGLTGSAMFWVVGATLGFRIKANSAGRVAYRCDSISISPTHDFYSSIGPYSSYAGANWFGYYDDEPSPPDINATATIHLVTASTPAPPDPEDEAEKYTVRTFCDPERGTVNPYSAEFGYGALCNLSATAQKGYKFKRWTCLTHDETSSNESYGFEVYEDSNWLAEFDQDDDARYRITVQRNGSGAVSPSGESYYTHGQTCTLAAAPASGWVFSAWVCSDGTSYATPTHSFPVTADLTFTAVFVEVPKGEGVPTGLYDLRTYADGDGVTSPGSTVVRYGETVTISATANPGSRFVVWVGPSGATAATPTLDVTVVAPTVWTAFFVPVETETGGQLHRVTTVVAAGKGVLSGAGLYREGANYRISARAPYTDEHGVAYDFRRWTSSDGTSHTATSVGRVMGDHDVVYNAYYEARTKFDVRVAQEPSGSGTSLISCDINTTVTGTGKYGLGETCRLSATPVDGAKLILFYTVAPDGTVTRHDGGSAEITVTGDTDVYALSLFDEAKFSYCVDRIAVSGGIVDADVSEINIDKGFAPAGGLGTKHKVGDEFDVEATLKVDDKMYDLANPWLRAYIPAINVVEIELKPPAKAHCKIKGDCGWMPHVYREFTNPDPYFRYGEYTVDAQYTTGSYSVAVSFQCYTAATTSLVTFANDVKSMSTFRHGVYECGTPASFTVNVSRKVGVDQGWRFLVRQVTQDGYLVASNICKDGTADTVELDTDSVEKGKTVDVVVQVWHEPDGKVLCDSDGDIICHGGDILSR